MLLNILMMFGVMQTSGLFCMHKLTKLTKIVKPVNMSKFAKSKPATRPKFGKTFKRYNSTNFYLRISPGTFIRPRTAAVCFGVIGLVSYFIFKKRGISKESEVFDMCDNLMFLLENEPKNIDKGRIILNQPKLVDWVNEAAFNGILDHHDLAGTSSAVKVLCKVIGKAVNENNQAMVRLFATKFPIKGVTFFPIGEEVVRAFLFVKDHEDPVGMARLLIN